jgi:2'-5' RNA ligase
MIGYWLLPAERERRALFETIRALAARYDAPIFEPHVTLFACDQTEEDARLLVQQIAPRYSTLKLTISGIEYSNEFTKTLFVQFAPNESAAQLSEAVAAEAGGGDYTFNPHLSLLYATVGEQLKAKEAARVELPFAEFSCDKIAAIVFRTPINSRSDVEAWRTIATAPLKARQD